MKNYTTKDIIVINKKIAAFMGSDIFEYRDSGMVDTNGKKILEGSIINADGYNSIPEEDYFHIVEYFDIGGFGSDIYSDFDKLSSYQTIEVIGHVTDYIDVLDDDSEEARFSNINGALKGEATCVYHRTWNGIMPVLLKIAKLQYHTRFHLSGFPINVTIVGSGGIHIAINQGNCAGEEYKGDRIIVDTLNLNYACNDESEYYTEIQMAWIGVGSFMEWYEKNKSDIS